VNVPEQFRTFEDLEVYQVAREFRKTMYAVSRRLQLLNGYIRYLRERKAGASLALHKSYPAYGLTEDDLDITLHDDSTVQRFNDSPT